MAGTGVAAGVKNGVGTRVGAGVVPATTLALVRHGNGFHAINTNTAVGVGADIAAEKWDVLYSRSGR